MEVLKGRLKSFETMNEAKIYIEKCKVKWMGPIGVIKDEETGRFDVYILEYPELMNADLSVLQVITIWITGADLLLNAIGRQEIPQRIRVHMPGRLGTFKIL